MRLTAADHINIRIRDVEATLAFYHGVLGLEPDRLDDFREGRRPLFAFRVNEQVIGAPGPLPALVTVHCIVTPDHGSDLPTADLFDLAL